MAATLERCIGEIRAIQQQARADNDTTRPRWPMIVLRSPKGWTGPKEVDGHKVEDFWRSHQVPCSSPDTNPEHLQTARNGCAATSPKNFSMQTAA